MQQAALANRGDRYSQVTTMSDSTRQHRQRLAISEARTREARRKTEQSYLWLEIAQRSHRRGEDALERLTDTVMRMLTSESVHENGNEKQTENGCEI